MKCVAHKLQLVLKDAFESNDEMLNLKRRVMKIVKRFTSSHIAARLLKLQTNK